VTRRYSGGPFHNHKALLGILERLYGSLPALKFGHRSGVHFSHVQFARFARDSNS
jgi:hypothetical protein